MATIMGCVHSHPSHRFSNIWKLLSIQWLIPAQKGICICTERQRESVYRQSSPVSGRRPPWWIMLPNNGSGLSQSEHAPIAGRHTNMLLFLFPSLYQQHWRCPLVNAGLQYVFIFTNECPSFRWKANNTHQSISIERAVARTASHTERNPSATACL